MSKKSRSKLWFLVHSWLALPIWFFALAVCVTGTVAVVSQELVWLANPEIRANKPANDAHRLDYDEVITAIASQNPKLDVQYILRPDEAHFALQVQVVQPDHTTQNLYVNPFTGKIQGSAPSFDFRGFTRALHGWWLVPFTNGYPWGWYLVSLLAVPMLASLVTGLVVYKRFWKAFLKPTLRLHQGARIFWGDFHRLSSVWSIWFIAIISITGLWFLIQAVLADNQISISSRSPVTVLAREDVPLMKVAERPRRISLQEAVSRFSQQVPGFEASFIRMPGNAYDTLTLRGRGGYRLMNESASLDPYSGRIIASHKLSDRKPLEFVTESMRPLHTGDFGGLGLKLVWFGFGLILSMMVLSGLLIWSKRTLQATSAAIKRGKATPAQVSPRRQVWLKWRFHLNVLLVVVPVLFLPRYFADQALFKGVSGLGEREIGIVPVGPWHVRLAEFRAQPPRYEGAAGYIKSFSAALCETCISEVKATYLRLGKPRNLRTAGGIFFGSAHSMGVSIPVSVNTPEDALLWVTMEGWDGSLHQGSVSLKQASPATLIWLQQTRNSEHSE
jgi:uncharacterized iron-regulated membrane protein